MKLLAILVGVFPVVDPPTARAQHRVIGTLHVTLGVMLIGIFGLISGIVPLAGADSDQLVRTESGQMRCDIVSDRVGCQHLEGGGHFGFPQAPIALPESQCRNFPCPGGIHWDIANVTSGGAFSWMDGNIPGAHPENDIILNYGQTYHIVGWTISSSSDGTRFTNDGTGHGMFVSIENVSSF
ncbi:MAG: hypothetical protein ACLPXZ_15090 [Mycobacterium sp.]